MPLYGLSFFIWVHLILLFRLEFKFKIRLSDLGLFILYSGLSNFWLKIGLFDYDASLSINRRHKQLVTFSNSSRS